MFSAELDTSIFTSAAKNEIILCLNYYWSKSVEQKILERIKPIDNRQDIALLKSEIV